MIKSVKELREEKYASVCKRSGIYKWWFRGTAIDSLLTPLGNVNKEQLLHKKINNVGYYALYFGIAKSCRERLAWHIGQHHNPSSVKSGYLSTLRQTLSALLGCNMTKSEKEVNEFMDDNCYLEWEYTNNREEAHIIESSELCNNYYPLNIQGNKVVPCEIKRKLSQIRKMYKK